MRRISSGVQNHVMAQKRTIKKRIKNWHKSLLLFCFLLIYLVFGAVVFIAIEGESQLQAQTELNNYSWEFFAKHNSCMVIEDLRDYVELLLTAIEKGAILSKEFESSNDQTQMTELWNLPNAFFFSSTVVTTIGILFYFLFLIFFFFSSFLFIYCHKLRSEARKTCGDWGLNRNENNNICIGLEVPFVAIQPIYF